MPLYERINAVVSLTLIGLAFYFILEFPVQAVIVPLPDVPFVLNTPRQWLMTVLLGALVMAGTDTVIRAHPRLASVRLSYLATFWMLPGLLVILATQALRLAPDLLTWAIALVGVGVALWLTIITAFDRVAPSSRWAEIWEQLVGYGLALGSFVLIYQSSAVGTPGIVGNALVSLMVALSLLRQHPPLTPKVWLFAGVIGLAMGQITWALNYWRVDAWTAGLLLLLLLTVAITVARQHLSGTLRPRTLWELAGVTAMALLVIFYGLA